MTIEDGALELPVVVTGKEQAIGDLRAVDQAATKTTQSQVAGAQATARAAQTATTATQAMGRAAQGSGVQVQQFGSTLGMAAQGIGRFSQQGGQMVSVLGQAVGSIGSMGASMGPWGVAIGVATTAFGLLTTAMSSTRDETSRMAEEVRREAIPALDDLIDRATELQQALTVRVRVRRGEGSSMEQSAYAEEMQHYISEQGGYAGQARERGDFANADRYEREQRRARQDLAYRRQLEMRAIEREQREAGDAAAAERNRRDRERYEMDLAAAGGAPERRTGGRRPGGGRAPHFATGPLGTEMFFGEDEGGLPEYVAEDTGEAARGRAAVAGRRQRGAEELASQMHGALSERQDELGSTAIAAAEKFSSAWRQGVDATIEAFAEMNAAAAAAGRTQADASDLMAASAKAAGTDIVKFIGESVTGAFRQSVAAWLDGSKSFGEAAKQMAASVVQALVAESIVQAVVETARGVTALASVVTAPLAPGHFAAAAAWGGVALAAGTVGLLTGTVGSPAGGGGAAAAARTPERMPLDGRDRGGNNYTINISGALLMGPAAQIGRVLQETIDTSVQRFGG